MRRGRIPISPVLLHPMGVVAAKANGVAAMVLKFNGSVDNPNEPVRPNDCEESEKEEPQAGGAS